MRDNGGAVAARRVCDEYALVLVMSMPMERRSKFEEPFQSSSQPQLVATLPLDRRSEAKMNGGSGFDEGEYVDLLLILKRNSVKGLTCLNLKTIPNRATRCFLISSIMHYSSKIDVLGMDPIYGRRVRRRILGGMKL